MIAEQANGRAIPSTRFQEVQEGLALRKGIIQQIAELEQADRETEVRLITIRTMLANLREQLAKARHAAAIGSSSSPPTPSIEELS